MNRRRRRLSIVFALAAALFAGAARAEEVLVFAAASLAEALGEIAKASEAATGDRVVLNLGASSVLGRQIEEGAPADLFFSADEAKVDRLELRGLVADGTRRDLLSNRLVVVVAAERGAAVASAADLATSKVRVLALAEPQTVPAGIYAKEYLRRAGLWRRVIDKVVPTENVRAALAAVEAGNADAAIVYQTDVGIARNVRVAYEVPRELTPRIVYVAAVVKGAAHEAAARRFLDHLGGEAARTAFDRYGFLPPQQATAR
jgi:molybdate transport system substrate-binding protein